MKKEVKEYTIIKVLILLTGISLIMNSLLFTNMIYSSSYDTTKLNHLLVSTPFNVVLWINNILIYIFGIVALIKTIRSKEEKVLKISFVLFAIMTTIFISIMIINMMATLFGIF